jgi:hypothetical protein
LHSVHERAVEFGLVSIRISVRKLSVGWSSVWGMTATLIWPATDPGSPGGGELAWLGEVMAGLDVLSRVDGPAATASSAELVDLMAVLERVKAAAAAAQSAVIVSFGRAQVAAQRAAEVDYRKLGRGIAEQVGLACKVGPTAGARRLETARVLHSDLVGCLDLLARGQISEYVAQLVVVETSHLDAMDRQRVDERLVAAGIDRMSPREAGGAAPHLGKPPPPAGSWGRGRTARSERRVTCRPAPDTIAYLSAFLPVEQGVQCWTALTRHADTAKAGGDERSHGQIMADTLVERLTGQASADTTNIETQLTMPVAALLDPDDPAPADLAGHGPIPAWLAHDLLHGPGRKWWRRLFTAPTTDGATMVVGGDQARRSFTGWLAQLIRLRDRTCAEPFCAAPIRHLDHIVAYRHGGPTTYSNGRGLCERHNYTREMPGWTARRLDPTTVATTTPTDHTYLRRSPEPP